MSKARIPRWPRPDQALALAAPSGIFAREKLEAGLTVLSRLESRQQALIFGHAVPMPAPIKIREYGSAESYRGFVSGDRGEAKHQAQKDIEELWG